MATCVEHEDCRRDPTLAEACAQARARVRGQGMARQHLLPLPPITIQAGQSDSIAFDVPRSIGNVQLFVPSEVAGLVGLTSCTVNGEDWCLATPPRNRQEQEGGPWWSNHTPAVMCRIFSELSPRAPVLFQDLNAGDRMVFGFINISGNDLMLRAALIGDR